MKEIIEKIKNKVLINLNCEKIEECLYSKNIQKNREIKKILFYFPISKYMHLGDHLFFEPVMRNLKKIGYEVYVLPTSNMKFYFLELGYKTITEKIDLNEFDLIITRNEFYKYIYQYNNILFYDYINIKLKDKICRDIIIKIFKYLKINITYEILDDKPSNLEVEEDINKFNLDSNKKYVLFNNYLDSGKIFNFFSNYNQKFAEKIIKLKNQGYQVIHLGTLREKNKDKNKYEFVDIDLRGKTNIRDLFYLSSLENIEINVGFDAFLMHLFFLNNKKNYIYLRNKITAKRKKITLDYLNPPYIYKKNNNYNYLNNNKI